MLERFTRRYNRLVGKGRWWLRSRFKKRYRHHIVYTDLEPGGWHDQDIRMLHACFALLVDYVDEEYRCFANWEGEPRYESARDFLASRVALLRERSGDVSLEESVLELYDWWTVTRPANEKRVDQWMLALYGNAEMVTEPVEVGGQTMHQVVGFEGRDESMGTSRELNAFRDQLQREDQENLHRLIDIRPGLWT